ncbi:MAG: class I SAM-dependent methyltransferase [Rhizobacter sp.]|nr:class I SAM-dependent methyltransferase [Ferruginibacter sp.]
MTMNSSCKKKIASFASLLSKIEVAKLHCSAYPKRYLHHLLTHKYYYLAIYAHVLDNILEKAGKPADTLNLLDFGSGNGLLGLFAKHCGFNKVFLCDANANFVKASAIVAKQLDIKIDAFITGELAEVNNELPSTTVDIIAGTDVIEHIYDLNQFFAGMKKMNPQMITVFTTASNPDNYFKVQQLKKLQVKDELIGGDPEDFALAGEEKHAAYLDIRKAIIQKSFPEISLPELENLAIKTRGLHKADIITSVHYYLTNHSFPSKVVTGTNTCHPETGSWSERILPITDYQQLYKKYQFELEIKNGFYNSFDGGIKSRFNHFRNLLIKILGKKTAPFITLIGFTHK